MNDIATAITDHPPLIGRWNDHEDDTHYLSADDIRVALCGRVVVSGFARWTVAPEDAPVTCEHCRTARSS